jgi:hypothetical protein
VTRIGACFETAWRTFGSYPAVFILSLIAAIGQLLGTNPPFQGKELSQLQATSTFITALLTAIGSGVAISLWIKSWMPAQFQRVVILTVFALLGILTARAAIRASFINYDYATEYLVMPTWRLTKASLQ